MKRQLIRREEYTDRLRKEVVVVTEVTGFHPKIRWFECFVWLGITTQLGKEKGILKTLEKQPEISQNFVEIGKYNISSLVMPKSIDYLPDFVDALKKKSVHR